MSATRCSNCSEPASGRHSLLVDNNADFIANTDHKTPWGAVAACEHCYSMHAAGKEHGPDVLDASETATKDLRAQLDRARTALKLIADTTRDALDVIGDNS